MNKSIIMAIIAVIGLTVSAHAAPAKQFPPRDECLSIDGYFDLRQKFEDIVKRRDAKALLAMTAPTISWSFGGGEGKEAFARNWKLDSGKASPIWAELDQIIRLGCFAQGPDNPTMPHYFGQDPGTGDAGGGAALVLGPAVNVRTQPTTASSSLRKLNWEVVTTTPGSSDPGWSKVQLADGKTGFIRNDYLRDYLDYRIGFERKDKGWVISFFIAGD
ncbi:MAG: SH3 domain-containing protein [Sphingorhabdus sp.]